MPIIRSHGLSAFIAAIALAGVALAADERMQWQFTEFNDPDNKGRMTATLTYGVPETDAAQVRGICDAAPSTSVKFSYVTFGADTGDLKEGADAELRFSGGGFNHVMRGQVQGTQAEVGVSGVHLAIEHDDPIWRALLEKDSLVYLVPGYGANTLGLREGKDKINAFVTACRTYAGAIPGNATSEGKSAASQVTAGISEKGAFESAKELGTVEAWEAFLANYPSGFRADLARAYVKKLGAAAGGSKQGMSARNVTRVDYAAGLFIKNGPATWVEQRHAGGDALRFDEVSRSERDIKLFDKSRKVHINLDIAGGVIWYAQEGSQLKKLYDIVEAHESPGATLAPQAGNAGTARAKATSSEAGISCKHQAETRSQNSDTPVKITFINNSGMYRGILWLDFSGQPKTYANLNSGEQITLDTFLTHPWMITDGPGNCIEIFMPDRGTKVVTLGAARAATSPTTTSKKKESRKKKSRKKGCASGYRLIEGKCILRRDAASYCGPGYRLEGSKCVQGYRKPKPQKQLPSWQVEAIKKGCAPGQGWNAQEGCHEND